MIYESIALTAPSSGVKAPSFASGEAQYLNPKTNQIDAVLATEQQMRHVFEETIWNKDSFTPDPVIKDLPFMLMLSNGKDTKTCSSRELSHRLADMQIYAALNEADPEFLKNLYEKHLISDLLVQYLDPITFLGGYWFSFWDNKIIDNTTVASASLFESTIIAHNIIPQLTGATKFSRYKVDEKTLINLSVDEHGKKPKKAPKLSEKGFGMIVAGGEGNNRYIIESANLNIFDLRTNGLSRMRGRGVAETTITLVDCLLDYVIEKVKAQDAFYLRAKCTLTNENPTEVSSQTIEKLSAAVEAYMQDRNNDFGNPKAQEIRELFDKFNPVFQITDPNQEERPNAFVVPSKAIAQGQSKEIAQGQSDE